MSIKRVLVTGAAGYQAGFIIRRLRERYQLTLADRIAPAAEFADLPFIEGDITCYEDVQRASAGQDAVVHLVALVRGRESMPLSAYIDVMVKGTWNVAQACAENNVQRLVNISSVVAPGWPASDEQPYRVGGGTNFNQGDLFYALAKHLGEEIGNAYSQAHGLSVIHLRPGMIARDGANPEPNAEGQPAHWFCHVDPLDVAQAVEKSLEWSGRNGTFQVVAGRKDSLFDWSETTAQLGYSPENNWPEIEVHA